MRNEQMVNLQKHTEFSPGSELDRVRKTPKADRSKAIEEFKFLLAQQREGWVQCRIDIERAINAHPNTPREELLAIVERYRAKYRFGKKDMVIAETIIDGFLATRQRVLEVRKRFPNNARLVEYLTGVSFSQTPARKFQISVGPMSIDIRTTEENLDRIYYGGKEATVPSDEKIFPLGLKSQSTGASPIPFTVVKPEPVSKDQAIRSDVSVLKHEREHIKNALLQPLVYPDRPVDPRAAKLLYTGITGFFRKGINRLFNSSQDSITTQIASKYILETDQTRRALFLEEFFLLKRDAAFRRAADEILAVVGGSIKNVDRNISSRGDQILEFGESDNSYDYLRSIREHEMSKEVKDRGDDKLWHELTQRLLIDEYSRVVKSAIKACLRLCLHCSNENVVALLADKPLAQWHLIANRHGKTDIGQAKPT